MKLTQDELFRRGIEAHQSGDVQDADRYYKAVLGAQPKHPDANHNLGIIAAGVGKLEQAVLLFKTAIEANPAIEQFWISYIKTLITLNQTDVAKSALDDAGVNGISGEAFDYFEEMISKRGSSELTSVYQNVPQHLLNQILECYKQGDWRQTLSQTHQMLRQFPHSVDLYNFQGAGHWGLGNVDAAIESYQQVITMEPDNAEGHNNMGVALHSKGHLDGAISSYKQAIDLKSNFAQPHNNMGNILKEIGELNGAINSYKAAIKIDPTYALAYSNIGIALQEKGDFSEAIKSYRQAIKIEPTAAEPYNNMGTLLKEKGDLLEAINSYKRAIALNPFYSDALSNLGAALQANGEKHVAIAYLSQAIKINPSHVSAYYNIGSALRGATFKTSDIELLEIINELLDKKTIVRPAHIADACLSLLRFDPAIKSALKSHALNKLEQFLPDTVSDLSKISVLMRLMGICPLKDLEFEDLLSSTRSLILDNILSLSDIPEAVIFSSALALQCFTNEYIYSQTVSETLAIRELEKSDSTGLACGSQPHCLVLTCLASYKALHEYSWCHLLVIPKSLENLAQRQIWDFEEEERLKLKMQVLQEISDDMSLKVRGQYEENPYPRWSNLCLPTESQPILKVASYSNLKLSVVEPSPSNSPAILVAGCGTGQHSIETSARYKDCSVLAVDLSLNSLAYAKRMTKRLGIENIKYMQADILDLHKLDMQFDLVESVGVLHHMDDPIMGWRVLTDCLKPGGLMIIGLYSELARQHTSLTRTEIINQGISVDVSGIKSFRDRLINSTQEHHKKILSSSDFYSMSTLRDLLFHVQEHRFTIPMICECLDDLGLAFCGFENQFIVRKYESEFGGGEALYDLSEWTRFEERYPDIFGGMYQFWCQKKI